MKRNKRNKFVIIGIFYFIILLTISTAYSFFNEDLSLSASASISEVVEEKNYEYSYILQANWYDGKGYVYHYVPTLTYLGTEPTTGWNFYIKVPFDTEIVGCWNAYCKIDGEVLTISNSEYNGVLSPTSNSASPSFQMKTNTSDYEFEVIGASFNTSSSNSTKTTTDVTQDDISTTEDYTDSNTDTDTTTEQPINNTKVDYIKPVLNITGGWGNTTTYILNVTNQSESVLVSSWGLTIKFPIGTEISSLWGGEYNYDSATGILTLHGPAWATSLSPSDSIEINIHMNTQKAAPYTPELGKFTGITITGETIEADIQIGGNS